MNTSDQFHVHGMKEELERHRDSIPPAERCPKCDGSGMVLGHDGFTYEPCPQCGMTGREPKIDNSN
jgi:DnaJ-class molecular chaperone